MPVELGPPFRWRLVALCAVIASLLLPAGATSPQSASGAAAQPEQPAPRFRSGANLVRVDVYVSAGGKAVADLAAADFRVFEDDQPQRVETVELIRTRDSLAPATRGAAVAASTGEQRIAAADPSARVFVVFLDTRHVGLDGSFRSHAPVSALLEQVIGPNDLVAVMTPDMSPTQLTLVRRGEGIDRRVREGWDWGQRDAALGADTQEADLRGCYPPEQFGSLATDLIERRREEQTFLALDGLIAVLDGMREERKFVVVLSPGWVLFRPLTNPGAGVRRPPPPAFSAQARARASQPRIGVGSRDWCDRESSRLSALDHTDSVRRLSRRANRANVSFYALDPRGLAPYDMPAGPTRPAIPPDDGARLHARQDSLRVLAEESDGAWALNSNNTAVALTRMLADTADYYLVSYHSTNTRADGRFRRIRVEVERDGVTVRSRAGYLAPTEAELVATAGVVPASDVPEPVARALAMASAARAARPVRAQAAGTADRVRAVVELDSSLQSEPEWQQGGRVILRVVGDGTAPVHEVVANLPAGQRSLIVEGPADPLQPGTYVLQIEVRPPGGGMGLRASVDAIVGGGGAAIAPQGLPYRRGPGTGLAYVPTADPRFRRTERLRLEIPMLAERAAPVAARVLTRRGRPLDLGVALREADTGTIAGRTLIADVTLAPLAPGDYVLEAGAGDAMTRFGFTIVP